jgi:hypothetical protein
LPARGQKGEVMPSPCSRAARVRQAILAVVSDYLSARLHGDDCTAAEAHDTIEGILEDAFAEERSRVVNDIRPQDE